MTTTTETDAGVDLPLEAADLIDALKAAQDVKAQVLAQAKPYDDLIESLTERLQNMLGDAEFGRIGGVNRVQWIRVRKFDAEAFIASDAELASGFYKTPEVNVSYLKKVRPDLYDRFSAPGGSRRFSIVDGA